MRDLASTIRVYDLALGIQRANGTLDETTEAVDFFLRRYEMAESLLREIDDSLSYADYSDFKDRIRAVLQPNGAVTGGASPSGSLLG